MDLTKLNEWNHFPAITCIIYREKEM